MDDLSKKSALLTPLVEKLRAQEGARKAALLAFPSIQKVLQNPSWRARLERLSFHEEYEIVFLALIAIGQHEEIFSSEEQLIPIVEKLAEVEAGYRSIGGIVGYHLMALSHLTREKSASLPYKMPPLHDMREESPLRNRAIETGIMHLHEMGEVYLLGGLGDRLNLKDERGRALPVAYLPFEGKTLLHRLIRDVEAREELYYKLMGRRITIPLAMMTSLERENEAHIRSLLVKEKWFNRDPASFFIFPQISVPVITQEGMWAMKSQEELHLFPGGHGAFWRQALDAGLFHWFLARGKRYFLLRQINNPLGGLDHQLLALLGLGIVLDKSFGFAACERICHAAEGAIVEREGAIVNIEYTDFQGTEESTLPANINLLFVDLKKMLPVIKANPLPPSLLNMKSKIKRVTREGQEVDSLAGRLETMVQNISEYLPSHSTFVLYNERKKSFSAAKRAFVSELLETPLGARYDLLTANKELLERECCMRVPPFVTREEYLKSGPNWTFTYDPILGPLYSLIKEKIQGGEMKEKSHLNLDISELLLHHLHLQGSLNIVGRGGCALLRNVSVIGDLEIELEGQGAFIAEGVTFLGKRKIKVADGMLMVAHMQGGVLSFREDALEEPLQWSYEWDRGNIALKEPSKEPYIFSEPASVGR